MSTHQEFKMISMMDLRSGPGDLLDRVSVDSECFVIERNGIPKACLVPVKHFMPNIPPKRLNQELQELRGTGVQFSIMITEEKELAIRFPLPAGDPAFRVMIKLHHGYPNVTPNVSIDGLEKRTPHTWADGSICFLRDGRWNPGKHDLSFVVAKTQEWIEGYQGWITRGKWGSTNE